jgi:epoxide hydrolase 4
VIHCKGGRKANIVEESWTHHQAIVNGVRLHYVEAGEGPLVVLLHGFPEFWWSWRFQIRALAEAGYRVIAPDMRGYNISEKPPGVQSYRIHTLVADIAALIRHAGADNAMLVGHDWGGVVAWYTAARYPDLIPKLVILNAPHPDRFSEVGRTVSAQRRMSWYVAFFQLPWLPELLLPRTPAQVRRFFLGSGANPAHFDAGDAQRYAGALNQPGARTATLNYYRSIARRTFRRRSTREPLLITMPTLLLWGKHDVALHIANADAPRLRRWVSDLRVELLDASHWVQMDVPEQVNTFLIEFFDGDPNRSLTPSI